MRRTVGLLAVLLSVVLLSGCGGTSESFRLQRQCQDQHGSWDSYHDTCSYDGVPPPTATVTARPRATVTAHPTQTVTAAPRVVHDGVLFPGVFGALLALGLVVFIAFLIRLRGAGRRY